MEFPFTKKRADPYLVCSFSLVIRLLYANLKEVDTFLIYLIAIKNRILNDYIVYRSNGF